MPRPPRAVGLWRQIDLRPLLIAVIGWSFFVAATDRIPAQTPLHEEIDRAITERLTVAPAPIASDAQFVRRVYLDLVGVIPTSDKARRFLEDPDENKREHLIDRLLESPLYARHMQAVFDVMWMERRGGGRVPAAEWQEYLRRSFSENKPFDELALEILGADGVDVQLRPAARFYLDREGETNLLTRDVARLFFGMDFQCAQCHDHPLVDDYEQRDYYGLYAFLNRSFIFHDKKQKRDYLAEKAEGDVTYKSVFDPETTNQTRPHLPGTEEIEEPQFEEGQAYVVAPADDVRPVPKFSRRAKLAEMATSGQDSNFNRNIVNRLWALLMGRGLVHPVGLHHSENPPSHPELLERLAAAFVTDGSDIKAFLRQLALSETYQRSGELPEGVTPEQLPPESFGAALLKPLSPEQLAWSVMQATGTRRQRDATAREKLRTDDPRFFEILEADAKRRAIKETMIEQTVFDQLKGSVGGFVSLFGALPGEPESDYTYTVQQALFMANGQPVQSWLEPQGSGPSGNLVARLQALEDTAALAEELYLSVLSRRPAPDEEVDIGSYLETRGEAERTAVLKELVWALLASTEFRFNH